MADFKEMMELQNRLADYAQSSDDVLRVQAHKINRLANNYVMGTWGNANTFKPDIALNLKKRIEEILKTPKVKILPNVIPKSLKTKVEDLAVATKTSDDVFNKGFKLIRKIDFDKKKKRNVAYDKKMYVRIAQEQKEQKEKDDAYKKKYPAKVKRNEENTIYKNIVDDKNYYTNNADQAFEKGFQLIKGIDTIKKDKPQPTIKNKQNFKTTVEDTKKMLAADAKFNKETEEMFNKGFQMLNSVNKQQDKKTDDVFNKGFKLLNTINKFKTKPTNENKQKLKKEADALKKQLKGNIKEEKKKEKQKIKDDIKEQKKQLKEEKKKEKQKLIEEKQNKKDDKIKNKIKDERVDLMKIFFKNKGLIFRNKTRYEQSKDKDKKAEYYDIWQQAEKDMAIVKPKLEKLEAHRERLKPKNIVVAPEKKVAPIKKKLTLEELNIERMNIMKEIAHNRGLISRNKPRHEQTLDRDKKAEYYHIYTKAEEAIKKLIPKYNKIELLKEKYKNN